MLLLHGNNRYHAKEHEYQGTDIVAENTYRAELGLHLYGRSWQETTTGANLVNSTYYFGSQNKAKIAIVNPDTDFAGREWHVNTDVENGNTNTGIAIKPNFLHENIKFKVGETCTMSGYVKGSFNSQNLFRINVFTTRIDGSLWKPTRLLKVEIPSQIKEYTRYSITFTLPEDFDESENNIIIAFSNLGGNYYFTKPMLQKGSILTAYEPYTGGNYTDSTGQQWVCDEVDFERGVYVQRVKKSTVKTLDKLGKTNEQGRYANWNIFSGYASAKVKSIIAIASYFIWGRSQPLKWISAVDTNGIYISPPQNTDYTVDTLKSYLIPLLPFEVCGILATPIETPLTEEELAAYKAIKSYPHYTHIKSAAELKVKLKIF